MRKSSEPGLTGLEKRKGRAVDLLTAGQGVAGDGDHDHEDQEEHEVAGHGIQVLDDVGVQEAKIRELHITPGQKVTYFGAAGHAHVCTHAMVQKRLRAR